jgi:orotate phosphoribosyltransferase
MSCFIICYILMPNAAVAKALLTTQAVKLQPGQPFTWSSGMQSPIYCDNRMLLSHPEVRTLIVDTFITMISAFSDVEGIAGVATGAIAWGALIADKM